MTSRITRSKTRLASAPVVDEQSGTALAKALQIIESDENDDQLW
jgi:hypothetical protein